MDASITIENILTRRKATRALGEALAAKATSYVETLGPLLRQRLVLGEHVQGYGKEVAKEADDAFKALQSLYDTIAVAAPFHLPKGLKSPLMQMTASLELTPWEYRHTAKGERGDKTIVVTSPLKWIVTYAGYAPRRLRELVASRNEGELQQFVLHYLAMHVVLSMRPRLVELFETLHFPITSTTLPGFGTLPITVLSSAISTELPPDRLLIESTELSGKDAFEELLAVETVDHLQDALREQLRALAPST